MITIQDLKKMTKPMITPNEAAQIIGCDPHFIRLQARVDPGKLGFPVVVLNTRTKIPRLPFIRFVEEGITNHEPTA